MPNWVKNNVRFYGNEESINRLKVFVKTQESDFDFNCIVPMPNNIYRGNLGSEERKIYGANNWYDWSIKNWGTKWDACDATWYSDDNVTFNTAWNMPEPIYRKLSKIFPDVWFTAEFADEDLGNYCGTIIYDIDGFCVNYENDFKFACDVWGYDEEEMKEELGYV